MAMPSGQGALPGAPGVILVDGEAAVDPAAGEEVGPHAGARAFGGNQDHIDKLGRDDAGLFAVDDAKTVREIQRVARLEAGA